MTKNIAKYLLRYKLICKNRRYTDMFHLFKKTHISGVSLKRESLKVKVKSMRTLYCGQSATSIGGETLTGSNWGPTCSMRQ